MRLWSSCRAALSRDGAPGGVASTKSRSTGRLSGGSSTFVTSVCFLVAIAFFSVSGARNSAADAAQSAWAHSTQDQRLNRLLERYKLRATDVGYYLFRLDNGHVVATHDPHTPRIPASTTKLLTALAAWEILGSDYRFETRLFTTGDVSGTVLDGDLYLVGGGDPSFSTPNLQNFVDALHAADIRRMRGRFIYDESLTIATSEINPRQPSAAVYNPGLSALSLNYNRLLLRWTGVPGTPQFRSRLVSPADEVFLPVFGVSVGPWPAGVKPAGHFVLDAGPRDRWLLSHELPARGVKELPVKRMPGWLAASLFRTYCRQRGIDLPLPQAGETPAEARSLVVHHSPPLTDLLHGVFRYSNNLSAELIGLVAGRRLGGRRASLSESADLLTAWYARRLPPIGWTGFVNENHSGLSSRSRHTPRQLAAAVAYAANLNTEPVESGGAYTGAGLLDLLSYPEWQDDQPGIRKQVKAKSGTMHYVDGLVGRLTTRNGTVLGFAILLTDFTKRAVFDAARFAETGRPPADAEAWTNRAKAFEQALVTSWAHDY